MFTFDSQTGDSQTSLGGRASTLTGIFSEESMIDEAVQLNELALMGSMLLSLLKFDKVCTRSNEGDGQGGSLSEEQARHQVLTDLKGCDSSL